MRYWYGGRQGRGGWYGKFIVELVIKLILLIQAKQEGTNMRDEKLKKKFNSIYQKIRILLIADFFTRKIHWV